MRRVDAGRQVRLRAGFDAGRRHVRAVGQCGGVRSCDRRAGLHAVRACRAGFIIAVLSGLLDGRLILGTDVAAIDGQRAFGVDADEDPRTGDLYVADLGTNSISLLTPIASGATASASAKSLTFNAAPSGPVTASQTVTITNTGTQPLAIGAGGLLITGTNGAMFPIAILGNARGAWDEKTDPSPFTVARGRITRRGRTKAPTRIAP